MASTRRVLLCMRPLTTPLVSGCRLHLLKRASGASYAIIPPSHLVTAPRRFYSGSQNQSDEPSPGLFGKVRQLTKQYGSAALVVYGVLSAADFGLSFVTIYLIGAEHVRMAEDWVLEHLNWKRASTNQIQSKEPDSSDSSRTDNRTNNSGYMKVGPPVSSVEGQNLLWTTAIVAYTIHKTFLLPVRVGLTAWLTPPIVRALRKRGWNVGKNLKS